MSADPRIVAALVRRRLLQRNAAQVVARNARRWDAWIARRAARPVPGLPSLVAIGAPAAVDDLRYLTGLAQLLTLDRVHVTPVLCLPTPAAAALFRGSAERAGFAQLLRIEQTTDPAAVAARLDPGAAVCWVPPSAVLTQAFPGALEALLSGAGAGRRDAAGTILARAGDLPDLTLRDAARDPAGLSVPLEVLLGGDVPVHHLTALEMILDAFDEAAAGTPPPSASPAPPTAHPGGTGPAPRPEPQPGRPEVRIASPGPDGEVLAEIDTPDGPRVFFRQRTDLLPRGAPFKVRPPLAAVGAAPARIRVLSLRDGAVAEAPLDLDLPASRIAPWMVTCYLNKGGAGNDMIRAFAAGIGAELRYAEDETLPRPGVPVVWGVLRGSAEIVASARRCGQYFFYVDHAYFGRGHGNSYRITRNAYEAGAVRRCPPDRIAEFGIEPQPWRRGGREILVCPPTEYFMQAHGCADWLETTLAALGKVTDRPLVVRAKPRPGETVPPLPEALQTAHALVTHSSNVAIEAAVLGTPVFVSPSSAAAPVGLTDLSRIETPVYPDRDAWLAHLAYNQFSFDEIRDGTAWRMLLEWEDRPLA